MRRIVFQKAVTSFTVVLLLAGGPSAVMAQPSSEDEHNSRIMGKVFKNDGSTPVVGATVLAYHLSTEQLFESEPSDGGGNFVIIPIPHGYFDLAVKAPDGRYDGTQVINVPPSGKSNLVFRLAPFRPGEAPRNFPGVEGAGHGSAQLREKETKGQFWRGPKGIAVIAGGGALVLLGAAGGGGSGGGGGPPVSSASAP